MEDNNLEINITETETYADENPNNLRRHTYGYVKAI